MDDNRPWRSRVGGSWEQIGRLQFEYLLKEGLKPHHYFLDVGCGSMRGGIHFIPYLENHHYFGIDKDTENLRGGKTEIKENNLLIKEPVIKQDSSFDFVALNQKFDFALAQSVFTHLPQDEIRKCLINMDKVLTKNGKFFATFFENKGKDTGKPIIMPSTDGVIVETYPDKDPYYYRFSEFEKLAGDASLKVQYIGDWSHPRSQKMMVFTKLHL